MEHHDHCAAQNQEELGKAITKHLSELGAQQFGRLLDVYDEDHLSRLSPITVPEPKEMVDQLKKIQIF